MTETQTPVSKKKSEFIAPILLLAPIVVTCLAIALYPIIIWSDPANNLTASSLFLLFSFLIIYLVSAVSLTLYFFLSNKFKRSKKIILVILISSAVLVALTGSNSSSANPGFPYSWAIPVYSTHCGNGLNSTYPGSYQCYTRQSGNAPNSIGIGLDIVLWIAIVELIVFGSWLWRANLKLRLSGWLWVLVASCYSAAIMINIFSIYSYSFPPVGYPISP
ncbi:MAG TPA: hypothetical protein VJN71_07220 [Nitrososphaerales archaeon]|nr:hypothetical protein [Nitrososphaerales archaeon]